MTLGRCPLSILCSRGTPPRIWGHNGQFLFMKRVKFNDRLRVGWLNGFWEGYHESRRCSRDTYPESYITKYTSIQ